MKLSTTRPLLLLGTTLLLISHSCDSSVFFTGEPACCVFTKVSFSSWTTSLLSICLSGDLVALSIMRFLLYFIPLAASTTYYLGVSCLDNTVALVHFFDFPVGLFFPHTHHLLYIIQVITQSLQTSLLLLITYLYPSTYLHVILIYLSPLKYHIQFS